MSLPKMKDYAQSPSDRGWLNKKGHTDGSAIDIGWRKNPNNPNQPAYSLTDAKVLDVAYLSDGGNLIVAGASYDDKYDMWWSVQHLQKLPNVKKGDLLKQGQQFGNMGNTGKSNGEHFHVRVSLVPKGSAFSWATFNNYRVDPVNYVYAYPHQDVIDLKKKPSEPFIKPVDIERVAQLGTFTATTENGSNIRKEPSTSSERVGGLPKGESIDYDYYVDNDSIRWVHTERGYIARRKLDNSEIFGDAVLRDTKTFINLLPKSTSYAIYRSNEPLNRVHRPNQIGTLNPSLFGGLSYECEKVSGSQNVYFIHTRDFGKVQIAQVDGLSTITNHRVYKEV